MLIEKQLLIPLVKCFSLVILALKNTGCLSFSPHAQPSIITCHSVLVSRRNIWENYQLLHFQPSINGCKTQNTIRLNPRAPLGASKNTSQGETWDWNGFQVFSPGFLPVGEKKEIGQRIVWTRPLELTEDDGTGGGHECLRVVLSLQCFQGLFLQYFACNVAL